jgi:hypothetical protein
MPNPLRWWGVRHVRYWWLRRQLIRWFEDYGGRAHGIGMFINPRDWEYLAAVWRGDA